MDRFGRCAPHVRRVQPGLLTHIHNWTGDTGTFDVAASTMQDRSIGQSGVASASSTVPLSMNREEPRSVVEANAYAAIIKTRIDRYQ